jgi:hypothetical protein
MRSTRSANRRAKRAAAWKVNDVDVEQGCRRQAHAQHALRQQAGEARRGVEGERLADHLRDGDPRHTQDVRLEGRRDGARVVHVVAHVGAEVDPRDDEVGQPILEHLADAEGDAVGGGSVDDEAPLPHPRHAQRPGKRQGVRDRGVLAVGGDHPHLANRVERLGEETDPLGVVAVVVADQQDRFAHRGSIAAPPCWPAQIPQSVGMMIARMT